MKRFVPILTALMLLLGAAFSAMGEVEPWVAATTVPTEAPDVHFLPTTINATAVADEESSAPTADESGSDASSAAPDALTGASSLPSSLDELDAEDRYLDSLSSATVEPTLEPTEAPNALPASLGVDDPNLLRVLLIGTDAYQAEDEGRSDTMIVAQINLQTADVKLVSFLRDLYVKIPKHGSTRLNAAYIYGGEELLKQTLENNFGVTVDRTVAVNFSLMVDVIDRIGGVDVEITESERKQLNSILKFYNARNGLAQSDGLVESAGPVHLGGRQALSFSRIRKIDSDFQRTGRQQKVLQAAFDRVRQLDALTLAALVTDLLPQIKTDFSLADVVALIPVVFKLDNVAFAGLTIPVSGAYSDETVNGMMVLQPNLKKNTAAISTFLGE